MNNRKDADLSTNAVGEEEHATAAVSDDSHIYTKKRKGVGISFYLLSLVVVALMTAAGSNLYLTGRTPMEMLSNQQSVLTNQEIRTLQMTFNTLMTDYIEELPREDLLNGAITGMTAAAEDPYTQYLLNQDAENLDMTIDGSFEGIGAQIIESDNFIRIISPIKGSPAEAAGLQPNDIILSVDGQSLEGMTSNEAVALIRGEAGTEVILEIKRAEKVQQVTVIRDTIPLQTVYGELLAADAEIGHIQITTFATPTYDDLVKTITDLRNQGAKRFIIDVRGNPGGLLPSVLQIANMFLDDGDIIMQVQEKGGEPVIYEAADASYGEFQVSEPVVVLVDGGSASASEILAAALQQSADVDILGTTTFGKGTVQTIFPVSDASELKVTVAKWLTPDGDWIHEEGLKPDEVIDLPGYASLTLIDMTKNYQLGDESEAVHNIEQILNVLGYLADAEVDSVYDESTAEAVSEIQAENNLPIDGTINDDTAFALIQLMQEQIAANDTQLEKAVETIKAI